ncbi:MAG: sulfate ABC transporter permease subunit CysW [Lachnospiraceae bacterium]|nr:sulfate ABC transporter permease subunit CysW [Lachnospiraceae bacterium]
MENETELRKPKGAGGYVLIAVSAIFFFVFLILPLVTVFQNAFSDGMLPYFKAVMDVYTRKATLLTLEVTAIALCVNTVFGLFAVWAVTKFQFQGKRILTTLIDLPVSVSPVIAGLMYILLYGRTSPLYPWLKSHSIHIVFAVPAIVIATIFVTFPYVFREIVPVLETEGTDEEEAAAIMGANWWTIFSRVTFPHMKWAFFYGIVLCTARAMGEFGAVSILSGHLRGLTNTLPLHVEILFNEFNSQAAFAVSSILVIIAIGILIVRSLLEARAKG